MSREHSPAPLIEQHYHIRELIERQEKRAADRNEHRNREKQREERSHEIHDSKLFTLTDFWCDKCGKDFKAQAVRQIEVDWTNPSQQIAYYRTKHWCGHWCMRLITDRYKDAFWTRSRLMRLDQGTHYADTLQPFQTGFKLLYGHKNKSHENTW